MANVIKTILGSTSQYTAGDNVGGLIDLTNLYGAPIKQVALSDKGDQKAPLELLLFRSQPAGTFTDNAALGLSDADVALICGRVALPTASYLDTGDNAIIVVDTEDIQATHAALYTTGTPTYASTGDLQLTFTV